MSNIITNTYSIFADLSAKHNAPLTITLFDDIHKITLSCIEYDYITIEVNMSNIDEIFVGSVKLVDDAKELIEVNEFANIDELVQYVTAFFK